MNNVEKIVRECKRLTTMATQNHGTELVSDKEYGLMIDAIKSVEDGELNDEDSIKLLKDRMGKFNHNRRELDVLKPGDVIYCDGYSGNKHRLVIDRVTKTMAITKTGTRFKLKRSWIRVVGESGWSTETYRIETPKLKKEYILWVKLKYVRDNINKEFPTEVIDELYDTLKKYEPKTKQDEK